MIEQRQNQYQWLIVIVTTLFLVGGCAGTYIPATSPDEIQESSSGSQASETTATTQDDFFDSIPDSSDVALYIQSGDIIEFKVPGEGWGDKYKIPPSGVIDLQYVGPYQIKGKTLQQVRDEIHDRLSPKYFIQPNLQVNFHKISKTRVLVLGEVQDPNHVLIKRGEGVMDALAEAGSLTQYSERTNMYVFRNIRGDTSVYRINYEDYALGAMDQNLSLRDGDLVYVHTNFWPHFDRLEDLLRPLGFGVNTLATIRLIETR